MTGTLLAALLAVGGSDVPTGIAVVPGTVCAAPVLVALAEGFRADPSEYYAFALVPTDQVRGLGVAGGTGRVAFQESPFGIAIGPDGSYLLDVTLEFPGLRSPARGALTVWVTTPSLDRIERMGTLSPGAPFQASVGWNKFLVVVTLEAEDDASATIWTGPIVTRGMSRSGLMHTMAGHGPFEQENCAAFGYGGGG